MAKYFGFICFLLGLGVAFYFWISTKGLTLGLLFGMVMSIVAVVFAVYSRKKSKNRVG